MIRRARTREQLLAKTISYRETESGGIDVISTFRRLK